MQRLTDAVKFLLDLKAREHLDPNVVSQARFHQANVAELARQATEPLPDIGDILREFRDNNDPRMWPLPVVESTSTGTPAPAAPAAQAATSANQPEVVDVDISNNSAAQAVAKELEAEGANLTK